MQISQTVSHRGSFVANIWYEIRDESIEAFKFQEPMKLIFF